MAGNACVVFAGVPSVRSAVTLVRCPSIHALVPSIPPSSTHPFTTIHPGGSLDKDNFPRQNAKKCLQSEMASLWLSRQNHFLPVTRISHLLIEMGDSFVLTLKHALGGKIRAKNVSIHHLTECLWSTSSLIMIVAPMKVRIQMTQVEGAQTSIPYIGQKKTSQSPPNPSSQFAAIGGGGMAHWHESGRGLGDPLPK